LEYFQSVKLGTINCVLKGIAHFEINLISFSLPQGHPPRCTVGVFVSAVPF